MKAKKFSIELSDEAEIDFDKSYDYYSEDSPKVADTFFIRINLSFEDLKQNPFAFPIAYNDVRKYVVKKFPFVIYYQVDIPIIRVVAIFHTSRNPEIWNERL
jgi:plasmid stabilization system protein ParE